MEILDTSKSLIENMYLMSGPILVFLGFIVFRQIKLTKAQIILAKKHLEESQKQAIIKSSRESISIAADQVKEYINEIIPLKNKLYDLKIKNSAIKFTGEIKNFTHDEIEYWDKKFSDYFLNKRTDELILLELEIVNRLESFAIYFTNGLADEKVAFSSIGKNFCNIASLYPVITLVRGSQNPNKYFENLVELYKCWKPRLEDYKIDLEKKNISKNMKENIERLENLEGKRTKGNSMKPIGTE
jgi:hypothetical protein